MTSIPNDESETTVGTKRVKLDDVQLETFIDWCSSSKIVIDFQKVGANKPPAASNFLINKNLNTR